jgi:hypothetical protein
MPQEDPKSTVVSAIWLNKREVARIDFTAEHELLPGADGWRVRFADRGSIRLKMTQGPRETLTVVAGDELLSSGEDFYLTIHAGETARRDRAERAEAKRSQRGGRAGDSEQGHGGPQKREAR